jgi:hypothetical protein
MVVKFEEAIWVHAAELDKQQEEECVIIIAPPSFVVEKVVEKEEVASLPAEVLREYDVAVDMFLKADQPMPPPPLELCHCGQRLREELAREIEDMHAHIKFIEQRIRKLQAARSVTKRFAWVCFQALS